jgi:hypothetical protein
MFLTERSIEIGFLVQYSIRVTFPSFYQLPVPSHRFSYLPSPSVSFRYLLRSSVIFSAFPSSSIIFRHSLPESSGHFRCSFSCGFRCMASGGPYITEIEFEMELIVNKYTVRILCNRRSANLYLHILRWASTEVGKYVLIEVSLCHDNLFCGAQWEAYICKDVHGFQYYTNSIISNMHIITQKYSTPLLKCATGAVSSTIAPFPSPSPSPPSPTKALQIFPAFHRRWAMANDRPSMRRQGESLPE